MLRSSRLNTSETELLHGDNDVRVGDAMTGWEIIAGLPLHDQKNLHCEPSLFPKWLEKEWQNRFDKTKAATRSLMEALCHEYQWNGTSWEVVE